MFKSNKKNNLKVNLLYNKILLLSRNKLLYTKFNMVDSFQNRINLIFLHTCFLFIALRAKSENNIYKDLFQKMFDFVFKSIEIDMRELGYGDTTINKNMKFITKVFYNIMLSCENFPLKSKNAKNLFLNRFLHYNKSSKNVDNIELIDYFNSFNTFCYDLELDNVIRGNLSFKYNKFIKK